MHRTPSKSFRSFSNRGILQMSLYASLNINITLKCIDISEKLSECWPCFDESQVVFFSTQKAQRDVNVDKHYISDNYKHFLEGLRSLYISAIERRIKQSYK